jgi:S-adenosylmethionine:tRNA ribosyltransferase-isomerase
VIGNFHRVRMLTSDFDYDLPPECIAQTPVEPRDSSRLLVLKRSSGQVKHAVFRELGSYLNPGDLLILNETRVLPARLYARKLTGGKVELLLLHRDEDEPAGSAVTWEVLVGGKGLTAGKRLILEDGLQAEIMEVLEGSRRLIRFSEPVEGHLTRLGHTPLPPYIHTPLANPERYQTVYARQPGSAAAPTAGLHFTPQLMAALQSLGIRFATVTLHVGLDTFAPVSEDSPDEHKIHTEWCHVPQETADLVNQTKAAGGRVIAVGTTSVRTLESAAAFEQHEPGTNRPAACLFSLHSFTGATSLYILPGYTFRLVDAMITNFHLPRSTLIMLVSAFAGRETVLSIYQTAVQAGYRFYSFGDAMLIL